MYLEWPRKSTFEPPRYPNVWLLISRDIAVTYDQAKSFTLATLEAYVGLVHDPRPSANMECADACARLRHVQPVLGLTDPGRDHYHDLHIRYYLGHMPRHGQHLVEICLDGQTHDLWRLAASVHYEPEGGHPGHPYIDECPVCGVVPPYDIPGDRCEKCHDPLGLELLFFGTVKDETVYRPDGQPVGGLQSLAADYDIRLSVLAPPNSDMNTLRIGQAIVLPKA